MRASYYTRPGAAAEVIEFGEQPKPVPGSGEVLVRVHTSGVNPSDWKNRRRPLSAPLIIPHSDGAGVIEEVGQGVPAARIGERVWTWNAQWKRAFGTAAEYVALPSEQAVRLAEHVAFEEAACFGIPLFTAVQAVRFARLASDARVLIPGGAGAVGHYAIQLAKLRGAEVITTVSTSAKAEHAANAGADHVIDYRNEDVAARVQSITGGTGVDCVLEVDLTKNAASYAQVLRRGARAVIYGASGADATLPTVPMIQKSVGLQFFMIYDISEDDRRDGIKEIGRLLDAGQLRHTIGRILGLDDIARAHELVEGGNVLGNVVLTVD